jgi:nicotinamidase-related amidase
VAGVVGEANRAIAAARERGDTIVAIGNEYSPRQRLANFFRRNAAIAGSPGAAWDDRVAIGDAAYFSKTSGDAFSNECLPRYLAEQGVGEVLLAGVMANACVAAIARGALARGLLVRLLAPAIGARSDRAKEHALRKLCTMPGVTVDSA